MAFWGEEMEGFLENAGFVLLLLGGSWAAVSSALKAREMRLSRVNEHGVRVWKSAADSFLAPLQINALWILAALFAFVAFVGLVGLWNSNVSRTVQPYSFPPEDTATVVPSDPASVEQATDGAAVPSDPLAVAPTDSTTKPPTTASEGVSSDIVDPAMTPREAQVTRDQTLNVYGLVVRRATRDELAERGVRRDYGLIIVDITPDSRWEGSRPDQLPPDVGDIILSGIGGGGWEDPADFRSYATRSYRVCVDARKAIHTGVTAFCTPATQ